MYTCARGRMASSDYIYFIGTFGNCLFDKIVIITTTTYTTVHVHVHVVDYNVYVLST